MLIVQVVQFACLSVVGFGVLIAALQPMRIRWVDDGDCQKLIQHTVRVPSNFERQAMWQWRAALIRELGSPVS